MYAVKLGKNDWTYSWRVGLPKVPPIHSFFLWLKRPQCSEWSSEVDIFGMLVFVNVISTPFAFLIELLNWTEFVLVQYETMAKLRISSLEIMLYRNNMGS